ncbi:MAG: Chromosomal replication initiator protein DnaA [Hyphomicrobiaceae bacterium hypho_1]
MRINNPNSGGTAWSKRSSVGALSSIMPNEPMLEAVGERKALDKQQLDLKWQKTRKALRVRLGEEVFESWFTTCGAEFYNNNVLTLSVPVKFLRRWIQSHYTDHILDCARTEFSDIDSVDIKLREPSAPSKTGPSITGVKGRGDVRSCTRDEIHNLRNVSSPNSNSGAHAQTSNLRVSTHAAGFEGSPLDSRYKFDAFVVGGSNCLAHAAASQVSETLFSKSQAFNLLYFHSAVGLGKTHLIHAMAWEVHRRMPQAQVLYLTAERFRFRFVEALQSRDALTFKDRFRNIDMLMIDDLEFLHGQHTETEFDHIINTLLDGGKQIVVASSRPPNQVDKLSDRLRSRLQRGLVAEISAPDYELRLKILERRIYERRMEDPSFEVPSKVLEMLAERLTENGREIEGAAIRLHAQWQYMRTPITVAIAETVIKDLCMNSEPRPIRIEDIIKTISRHFGISKPDILSQRRHRSVVWPRQIGMYLAKQLTARSLPEIGRRFGNRDHTTVLHAIRKIETALGNNQHLRDEIDDLKKILKN